MGVFSVSPKVEVPEIERVRTQAHLYGAARVSAILQASQAMARTHSRSDLKAMLSQICDKDYEVGMVWWALRRREEA